MFTKNLTPQQNTIAVVVLLLILLATGYILYPQYQAYRENVRIQKAVERELREYPCGRDAYAVDTPYGDACKYISTITIMITDGSTAKDIESILQSIKGTIFKDYSHLSRQPDIDLTGLSPKQRKSAQELNDYNHPTIIVKISAETREEQELIIQKILEFNHPKIIRVYPDSKSTVWPIPGTP